jgi:hypothetical protein
MLRDELSARLRDHPETADAWWDRLPAWSVDKADLALPLDRELISATVRNGDQRTRLRVVGTILGRHTDTSLGIPYRRLTEILWRRSRPTITELRVLCDLVPDGTEFSPAIFAGVLARARADPTGLAELALCAELKQHRLLRLDPDIVLLLEQNDWLEAFERDPDQLSADHTEDRHLLRLPPPLLNAHARPLARALLTLDDPVRVQVLLYRLPIGVVIAYLHAANDDPQSFRPKLVAAICVACARAERELPRDDPSRQIGDYVHARVTNWCREASKRKIRKVSHYLRAFDGELAMDWDGFAADVRRQRLWRLVTSFRR